MTPVHALILGALLSCVILAIADEWPPSDGDDDPWWI